jgi:hypothetical protein
MRAAGIPRGIGPRGPGTPVASSGGMLDRGGDPLADLADPLFALYDLALDRPAAALGVVIAFGLALSLWFLPLLS